MDSKSRDSPLGNQVTPKRGRGRPPESAGYPVRWQTQLSKKMHADLRARASEERITMAQVVREAVGYHLYTNQGRLRGIEFADGD